MPTSVVVVPAACTTPAIEYCVSCRAGPSTSRSLLSTLPVMGVSSAVTALSGTPTGASLTGVSTMATVPVPERLPSTTL